MPRPNLLIEDDNLTRAWAQAFQIIMRPGCTEVALVVTVTASSGGSVQEIPTVRSALDNTLLGLGKSGCTTVANTIFPSFLWNPGWPSQRLYERYARILPRLKSLQANRNGLYFERMAAYRGEVNQLQHVVDAYRSGVRRRSALQAALFDPAVDHTFQRQRGFPCLEHVSFLPDGSGGLEIAALYTTQYMIAKAYGNYLGLCNLGRFMAHEMDLEFTGLRCVATSAKRDDDLAKRDLLGLERAVAAALNAPDHA